MNKTKPVWRKGAPPSVGWWPASRERSLQYVRWWNGEFWSIGVSIDSSADIVGFHSTVPALGQDLIEWCNKWWL